MGLLLQTIAQIPLDFAHTLGYICIILATEIIVCKKLHIAHDDRGGGRLCLGQPQCQCCPCHPPADPGSASPSPVCFWPRQVTFSPQGAFFFFCSHSMVYWWLLKLHGAPLGDFSLIWASGCLSYTIHFYITAAIWSLVHMYIYIFTYICMYASVYAYIKIIIVSSNLPRAAYK